MVKAVRGAIKVSDNTQQAIQEASVRLVVRLCTSNRIREGHITSIVFSLTPDLDKGSPAAGLRTAGYARIPLFCVQEALIEGQPTHLLRVLMTFNGRRSRTLQPVYLDGAEALRPDLFAGTF